ncbi:MAG: DEAD/DEAH box helicase family protein [Bryobacterales bacterium]|nr:DEAD/DEAH box helicase family protein [Bryobacterales bacterium]
MTSKLRGLKLTPKRRSKETNPLKIFESLTLRGAVENIWDPQSEALRSWDAARDKPDVVVEMNTGGGKTLIGLLIAQSIINETSGQVVFVCPTIQLIEQARMRAQECGLEVATYYEGNWDNEEAFTSANGPCLTNYAAVFNGKSIFRRKEVKAFLLDDAHVAGPSVRASFTLRFNSSHSAHAKIINLFKSYFEKSGHAQELDALLNGDWMPLLFVPAFEINRHAQRLTQILVDEGVTEEKSTLFAWEHLRDRLSQCAILISAKGIEISPVSLPLSTLDYFSRDTRRIYLTATMPSPVQFAQTFGAEDAHVIRPGGKSGDSQRLFVFAPGETDEAQREWTKEVLKSYKACVIAPSKKQAGEWTDVATLYDGSGGQAAVEKFKKAVPPKKMVMAARYDGVDLPGDSCRVLVLDGIPLGSFAIERFIDQSLNLASTRTSTTAIRLTQAIGRIFRSNTDHGVVILCGSEIQNWVRSPAHQSFLPELLQRQLQFGMQLSEAVEEEETSYEDLIDGILKGDREWDRLYKSSIDAYDTSERPVPPSWLVEAAGREGADFLPMWQGNFPGAAKSIQMLADFVGQHDKKLAAWYAHWCGLAQEMGGQSVSAVKSYLEAANRCAVLGRPAVSSKTALTSVANPVAGAQANRIAENAAKIAKVHKALETVKKDLQYGENTKPSEEALAILGKLLGLDVTRPDNDHDPKKKTGPDVLWRYGPSKSGMALEAKTNKKTGSQYQKKDDIGQFHDHIAFLKKHFPEETFFQAIVGRSLPVSMESNPSDALRIVPLEGFQELVSRVEQLYNFLESSTDGDALPVKAERWLQTLGLSWPQCVDGLPYTLANDLKRGDIQTDQAF